MSMLVLLGSLVGLAGWLCWLAGLFFSSCSPKLSNDTPAGQSDVTGLPKQYTVERTLYDNPAFCELWDDVEIVWTVCWAGGVVLLALDCGMLSVLCVRARCVRVRACAGKGTDYYKMAFTLKEIVRTQLETYNRWRQEKGGQLGVARARSGAAEDAAPMEEETAGAAGAAGGAAGVADVADGEGGEPPAAPTAPAQSASGRRLSGRRGR